jgi:ABC-type lipoprotein release transport system permease subunit
VLGVATGTVVLLLAIASLLLALQDDPSTLGKRYELTARQQAASLADVRGVDGVEAVARRTQVEASAAFALGQPLRLVGFPRGAEDFEAPPLAEGRRRRAAGEAEVGVGLAETLGLRPGSTLAVALPTGEEVRFRVVGLVRALENEGRVAYVRSDRLEGAGDETLAVVVAGGADADAVSRGLAAVGAEPSATNAATTDNRGFLAILATLLRVVALTVALVCLVVLAQALVITARERRATLALLRTVGAGRGAVTAVLAGACAIVLVPAAVIGVALETVVLGPAVASLAAGYAGLSLAPTLGHVVLAVGGLAVLGGLAVAWVARRVAAEPVVAGLREEPV